MQCLFTNRCLFTDRCLFTNLMQLPKIQAYLRIFCLLGPHTSKYLQGLSIYTSNPTARVSMQYKRGYDQCRFQGESSEKTLITTDCDSV